MAFEKFKRHKSQGIDQISTELIIAGDWKILSEITQLINSTWNKKELLEEWKESIFVPISKKGDKTECSNYRGISHLSITYKILSNILLSKFTPNTEESVGDHWRGFRGSRSTTDHVKFYIRQMFEKKS
jgi:hypothetical protein